MQNANYTDTSLQSLEDQSGLIHTPVDSVKWRDWGEPESGDADFSLGSSSVASSGLPLSLQNGSDISGGEALTFTDHVTVGRYFLSSGTSPFLK